MKFLQHATLAVAGLFVVACGGGGGTDGGGDFRLIQFLDAGKSTLPRNRTLEFRFSGPVKADQDFPERLKISNVQNSGTGSDFSRAIGTYVVDADRVQFIPRLPERPDRSDAGLRALGEYHVFLKTGPDALESTGGDRIPSPQDFVFDTSEYFEDPVPDQPPRALVLLARDPGTDLTTEISRCETSEFELSRLDSSDLLAAGAAIDPGAGGPPQYASPWSLELHVSEPIDPQSVNTSNIRLTQVRENALQGADTASPGHLGTEVSFRVPIAVEVVQDCDECGVITVVVRVTPLQTLVDDARYRLEFDGEILGLDFRNAFIGANGLTGDGTVHSAVPQPAEPENEVGGLGYTTEFLVFDRPAILSSRTLTYLPTEDGIDPEQGQTAQDERLFNSARYDPVDNPGRAVGFLSAFGNGSDQDFSVAGGLTKVLDTGAEPNDYLGNPFRVRDMDPDDEYPNQGGIERAKAPEVEFDSLLHSEWEFSSLTIGSGSTLRITGVNPARLRVSGIVQIAGTIDASGEDGKVGGPAGAGGPGGFKGGMSKIGVQGYGNYNSGCHDSFDNFKNAVAGVRNGYPFALHGEGPGRGYAGGDVGDWYYYYDSDFGSTGGGGGGHGARGEDGEDRLNATTQTGVGTACTYYGTPYSLTHELRGGGGFEFGDREILDVTTGGPGGGAGGALHLRYNYYHSTAAGGGGGGGGGSVEIVASGPILATGGRIDVGGGAGGKGSYIPSSYTYYTAAAMTGGGGGGAGGALSLISGDTINLAGAVLDARGGPGGARPNVGTTDTGCKSCNGGGDGGKGYLFLMDADGIVDGLIQNQPGDYDVSSGLLTIRSFDGSRFQAVSAITELFQMPAADPDYLPLEAADIAGTVAPGQTIHLYASSARTSAGDPLEPDQATEAGFDAMVPIAIVRYVGGSASVEVLPGGAGTNLELLNPTGTPNRDAFARIRADFEYSNPVEAALGPFAMMDEVTIRFSFNG